MANVTGKLSGLPTTHWEGAVQVEVPAAVADVVLVGGCFVESSTLQVAAAAAAATSFSTHARASSYN